MPNGGPTLRSVTRESVLVRTRSRMWLPRVGVWKSCRRECVLINCKNARDAEQVALRLLPASHSMSGRLKSPAIKHGKLQESKSLRALNI